MSQKDSSVDAPDQNDDAFMADEYVEELQQQIADLTEALQRERADVMNVRRQTEEQIASINGIVKANVVKELLPVIDNLERAFDHIPKIKDVKKASPEEQKLIEWSAGVQKILGQFGEVLGKLGVEKIATVGQPFDPNFHEAVSMEEGEGDQEIVSDELQSGYKLDNQTLRPAMVRVKSA
jgi:molecular chaperone GrpE